MRITSIFTSLLVLCLGTSALVAHRLDRFRADSTLEDVLYLPSSAVLNRLSLGYNTLLADIYWTRAVQYFGGKVHERATRYDLLAPLLDITTDLDPRLSVAYQFGGIFLAQQPPEGAGQPRKAVALLEKGIRANPADWQLYYNLGWIYVFELKDYPAATKVFERGAQVPGAHPSLKTLAASTAQRGGDIATARLLWTQMYKNADNKMVRVNAIKHLVALKVDEEVIALEQGVQEYRRATGRFPTDIAELQASGWQGETADPLGNAYRIQPDGRVEVFDYKQLPFITQGLPPGKLPLNLPAPAAPARTATAAGQAEPPARMEEAGHDAHQSASPESNH